nr:LacI family DNA-binding transcriptional regulator [Nakamurella flavida]
MVVPRAETGRPVTIRDVAAAAGVSKSLVSLVLQGSAQVGEARRRAVLDAVADLGYRPTRPAQVAPALRSRTVGVVLNDLRNPWFVDLLEGLTTALDGGGSTPLLSDSLTMQRVGRSSVRALVDCGVDGLVVVGTTSEEAAVLAVAADLPVVLAGTTEPRLPLGDVVVNDDVAGARSATEHLIELGHRRLAHLRGPGDIGALRLQGFREAVDHGGLTAGHRVDAGGRTEESGYAGARRLLTGSPRPTAILAFNDIAAVGAMSAAADLGIAVPEELSVVGYDDTSLAQIRHLSLTSVDNGNFAVGAQAGRFLVERIADPSLPARRFIVPTRLVVRGTTASPRT